MKYVWSVAPCLPNCVEVLQKQRRGPPWTDPPFKESYQMCSNKSHILVMGRIGLPHRSTTRIKSGSVYQEVQTSFGLWLDFGLITLFHI